MLPSIRAFVRSAFALMLLSVGTFLQAEPDPVVHWKPVVISLKEGIDLQYVWQRVEGEWKLCVCNFGKKPIDFAYYLKGHQPPEAVHENGRVYLNQGVQAIIPAPFRNMELIVSDIHVESQDAEKNQE